MGEVGGAVAYRHNPQGLLGRLFYRRRAGATIEHLRSSIVVEALDGCMNASGGAPIRNDLTDPLNLVAAIDQQT